MRNSFSSFCCCRRRLRCLGTAGTSLCPGSGPPEEEVASTTVFRRGAGRACCCWCPGLPASGLALSNGWHSMGLQPLPSSANSQRDDECLPAYFRSQVLRWGTHTAELPIDVHNVPEEAIQ